MQISQIMSLILGCKPRSVLDIGVGFGKYGLLCREYLELWREGAEYGKWQCRIDGIEIHEDYLLPFCEHIYDQIFLGDALDTLQWWNDLDDSQSNRIYDLILLIDVIEHFTFDAGLELLQLCTLQSKSMLISTPKDFKYQEPTFGNAHEQHLSHWDLGDFDGLGPVFHSPNDESLIVLIGEGASKIRTSRG